MSADPDELPGRASPETVPALISQAIKSQQQTYRLIAIVCYPILAVTGLLLVLAVYVAIVLLATRTGHPLGLGFVVPTATFPPFVTLTTIGIIRFQIRFKAWRARKIKTRKARAASGERQPNKRSPQQNREQDQRRQRPRPLLPTTPRSGL
jgi:hypothetical protein